MILIGYIRVSNESQKNNLSLPVQEEAIRKWCLDNRHFLLRIERDIESAEQAETREGLQAALGPIFADHVDGMVVYKYDRFTRSVLDAEHLKARFKKAGKVLYSVTDPVDWGTDDGEMLYQFKSVFAEYERKQIRRRCQAGQERKAAEGGYAAGHPPFGYDVVKGELVKNELELRALSAIMEMRALGLKFKQIAEYLNSCNVPTKRGFKWTSYSVRATYARRPNIKLKLPA